MKVERKVLVNVLRRYINVARITHHDAPILGRSVENGLQLWYNSLGASIWNTIDVVDNTDISFSLSAETFYKLISVLTADELTLTLQKNNSLMIKSGRSRVTVPYYEGVFEEIEDIPQIPMVELPSDYIKTIEEASYFVAKTEDRPMLTCGYLQFSTDGCQITGSDAIHVYQRYFDFSELAPQSFLLPKENMDVLVKFFGAQPVSMAVDDNGYLLFKNNNAYALLGTFNELYPNIAPIISSKATPLFSTTVNDMKEALNIGQIASSNDGIVISSTDEGIFASFLKSIVESEVFVETISHKSFSDICLHIPFVLNCLRVMSSSKIQFYRLDSGAIKIMDEDLNRITLVQEIRL